MDSLKELNRIEIDTKFVSSITRDNILVQSRKIRFYNNINRSYKKNGRRLFFGYVPLSS